MKALIKKYRKYTGWIMLVTVFVWVGWDFFVYFTAGAKATESDITLDTTSYHFVSASLVGFMLAHLTWPVKQLTHARIKLIIAASYFAVLAYLDYGLGYGAFLQSIPLPPYFLILLNGPIGHTLWPQIRRARRK